MIRGAALRVLACFFGHDVRSFTVLCEQAGYPTDLGGYYIRQLIRSGHLEKHERGVYGITPKGKQELALAHGKRALLLRPRLAVLLVARQAGKYVILEREAQPFIGRAEWPAMAVDMGRPLADAAKETARNRLGVEAQPIFTGFFRRIDIYDGSVFDDKVFAVHTLELPDDTPIAQNTVTGTLATYSEAALQQLPRPAKSLLDIWQFVSSGSTFMEHTYELQLSDLAA